jgi:hypothetical protein
MSVNRNYQSDKEPDTIDTNQVDRFIEAARKLGCDEDEARFKEKLGKIAKAKPATDGKKTKER